MLEVDTWDDDLFLFGDETRSGENTQFLGSETYPRSSLGYLGGVKEGEVARIIMYWVPQFSNLGRIDELYHQDHHLGLKKHRHRES